MVSLVDIGPAVDTVSIRGQELEVNGLTAEDIVKLFRRYPELRRIVSGNADSDVLQTLFNDFPHLIAEIIAAVTGHMGDQDHIAAAKQLTLGEQWLILTKSMSVTFPQGAANFLDGLLAVVEQAEGRGWAQATTSRAQLSVASGQVVPKETAGEARQDS